MRILRDAKESANQIVAEARDKAKEEAQRIVVNAKMILRMPKICPCGRKESSGCDGSGYC